MYLNMDENLPETQVKIISYFHYLRMCRQLTSMVECHKYFEIKIQYYFFLKKDFN